MIAASLADLKHCAREAPRAVDHVLGPFIGAERAVVVTKDGPALVLQRPGHTGPQYAGLVVVLSKLMTIPVRCYRRTTRDTWTRVRP